jgi:hypothetical protein
MSHLTANHIKSGSFELVNSSGWQYGQSFPKIEGMVKQSFYVDPFCVIQQRLLIKSSQDIDCVTGKVETTPVNETQHVFRNYINQKDFDSDKGNKTWLEEFENYPSKYGFEHTANRTVDNPDRITDVIMKETGLPGFKYTVNYDGEGHWECNCQHHHKHPNTCCKHINAAIDYYCLEVAMTPREQDGKATPKWAPYTTTALLTGCLLHRKPVKRAFPGYTDIVTDLSEEEEEPSRKKRKTK